MSGIYAFINLQFDTQTQPQNQSPFNININSNHSISNHSNSNSMTGTNLMGFEYLQNNDSNHSNHSPDLMDDSNHSQSWLHTKHVDIEPSQQSMDGENVIMTNLARNDSNPNPKKPPLLQHTSTIFTQSNFLTPMESHGHNGHLSQLDMINNRVFNHTKSKIKHEHTMLSNITEETENESDRKYNYNHNNDDSKYEYVHRKDLKIPLENKYLDDNERINIQKYKKRQKGLTINDRYNAFYDEIEKLGNGSFGNVYKVRNRDDGCFYAIKKIKIQSIHQDQKKNKEKWMKEGLILSGLQRYGKICNHIISYNTMWIENSYFYLVTEFCDNGNLYNLRNLFRDVNDIESVFMKVLDDTAKGLEFIHDKGFVHFDVKPENILISKNCQFKLADFGLCTKIVFDEEDDLNENENSMNKQEIERQKREKMRQKKKQIFRVEEGDARYLCRELIEETYIIEELDKVDIFALGCTMYEIITGQDLPGNGFKWQQIRNGMLHWNGNGNGNSLSHKISISMKQLIITMMHSSAKERPSSKKLTIFLRKYVDPLLREKDNEIDNLKQKIQILLQRRK